MVLLCGGLVADEYSFSTANFTLQLAYSCVTVNHMKNITVSVQEEIYRRVRIRAAERDTSVSALVKGFLIELASEEPDAQRLEREERELREHIRAFRAGNRLSRDDVHGRGK
jgi:hypothetical protein